MTDTIVVTDVVEIEPEQPKEIIEDIKPEQPKEIIEEPPKEVIEGKPNLIIEDIKLEQPNDIVKPETKLKSNKIECPYCKRIVGKQAYNYTHPKVCVMYPQDKREIFLRNLGLKQNLKKNRNINKTNIVVEDVIIEEPPINNPVKQIDKPKITPKVENVIQQPTITYKDIIKARENERHEARQRRRETLFRNIM